MFDVAIIGAGPAGTSAAFDLLENGLTVLILDKYEFPRKKACAGGITPKGLNAFAYDISRHVKHVCKSVRITISQKKSFIINNKKPLCYTVDRKELDLFSLNKVIKKGAHFKVSKKIQLITERLSYVEIKTDADTFKAQYLIGADGANSIVRKSFAKEKFFCKQMAIEADVYIDQPDKHPMEFDFSYNLKGYYWIFPKDDHVNIGIYSVDSHIKFSRQKLSEYAFKRFGTRKLSAIKGYPICTNGFLYTLKSNRVFLVGDAAGMSERILGEGIYFAVKTGRMAAQSIVKAQSTGKSVKHLYEKSLQKIQMDLKLHDLGAGCLYRFPSASLKLLSIPFFHTIFAKGYADAKPLIEILCSFPLIRFFKQN